VIWEQRGDAVWLLLTADEDTSFEEALDEAHRCGYEDVDEDAIGEVVDLRQARSVATVSTSRRSGDVAVTVEEDGMSALLRVYPPGPLAPALTSADVLQAIEVAGITYGVLEEVIGEVPLDRTGSHVVAKGTEPVDGVDGEVLYTVPLTTKVVPVPRDDGGVDLRAEAEIPSIAAGAVLAHLVPPKVGKPGYTVTGEELLARSGKPAKLPPTKNVEHTADGLHLVAAIDGLLELSPARVAVRPDLTIRGDVDFESGSIDFHGDVQVLGSVRPGFRVKAGGRVVINGDVDQAEIEAESLVWVRGAVVGDHCIVRSNGDVKVRTLHEARVEARGSVFVEREAMEATILASGSVIFESPRNRLVGGLVVAAQEVMAAEIGAVAELPTQVRVGVDPFTAEEETALNAERIEKSATLERVSPAVASFVADPLAIEMVEPERRDAVERLIGVHEALVVRLEEIDRRLEELRPPDDPDAKPRIIARMAMRPGVSLQVRRARRTVDIPRFRVAAVEVGGAIELVGLEKEMARMPRARSFTR
jgi:uncharacterized protein (DUF342 family)